MTISVKCTACAKPYEAPDELAGKRVACKCGCPMVLPSPVSDSDDDVYDLAPAPEPVEPSVPPDEAVATAAAGSGAYAPPETEEPPEAPPRAAPINPRWIVLGSVGGTLILGVLIYLVAGWLFQPGFGSPEEAFRAFVQAAADKDWEGQLLVLSPESRDRAIGTMVLTAQGMAASSPEIREVLRDHGVEETMEIEAAANDAPLDFADFGRAMAERQKRLASAVEDPGAFYADFMEAFEEEIKKKLPSNPYLKFAFGKAMAEGRRAVGRANLKDLEIDGDTAQGSMSLSIVGREFDLPVMFKRVDGRWFIHTPDFGGFGGLPFANPMGLGSPF
ncbi:MAG: hypothetical protein ACYTG0_10800 [Planctomycetota bacterium]